MESLVLPLHLAGHWVPKHSCAKCGQDRLGVRLLYPRLRREGTDERITYPTRCPACGHAGSVSIRLPRLLLGLILIEACEAESIRHFGKSKRSMVVTPGRTRAFVRVVEEYLNLLSTVCGEEHNTPLDLQRELFGLDEAGWDQFLRRLGLQEEESQDEGNEEDQEDKDGQS